MENQLKNNRGADVAVPIGEKISYGLGCLGENLIYCLFTSFLMLFYTDYFGLTAAVVGTLFLGARIWDAVNDPLMGMIVDRSRSRWGRFRPFLLFAPIPVAITTVLCFSAPNLSQTGKIIYASITYILWGMSYTALDVPFWSLSAVITRNPDERNKLVVFPRMIGTIGYVLAIVAVVPLVGILGKGDDTVGYQLTAVIFGVSCIIFSFIAFRNVRERVEAPKKNKFSIKDAASAFTKNPPFLCIILSGIFSGIALYSRNTVMIYYMRYNIGNIDLFPVVSGAYVPFTIIGMLLVPGISKKIGKKNTYIIFHLGLALTSAGLFIAGWHSFPVVLVFSLISGLFAGAPLVLQTSMLADTIEYSQWKNGIRMEGLTFSAQTFIAKLTAAVSGGIVGWALQFIGYIPNEVQTQTSLQGIHFLTAMLPCIGALCAIVPMFFYSLSDKKYISIVRELEEVKNEE